MSKCCHPLTEETQTQFTLGQCQSSYPPSRPAGISLWQALGGVSRSPYIAPYIHMCPGPPAYSCTPQTCLTPLDDLKSAGGSHCPHQQHSRARAVVPKLLGLPRARGRGCPCTSHPEPAPACVTCPDCLAGAHKCPGGCHGA